MKKNDAYPSTYLKQEDLGTRHVLVTIDRVELEKMPGDDDESKPVAYFVGHNKGLALNRINWDTIEDSTGQDDSDNWHGLKIVLYVDPKVMFGGKRVGGIRVMAPPKNHQVQPSVRTVTPARPQAPDAFVELAQDFQASDEDVPF